MSLLLITQFKEMVPGAATSKFSVWTACEQDCIGVRVCVSRVRAVPIYVLTYLYIAVLAS